MGVGGNTGGNSQASPKRSIEGEAKIPKLQKDAGRVNGSSAIHPTEDATRRRLGAARTCSGSVDRAQVPAHVPDAPVSNFSLTLDGGHEGLLENEKNLCAHPLHVTADITDQNGKTANQNPVLQTPCGKKHKHKHKHTRHSRARHTNGGGGR